MNIKEWENSKQQAVNGLHLALTRLEDFQNLPQTQEAVSALNSFAEQLDEIYEALKDIQAMEVA